MRMDLALPFILSLALALAAAFLAQPSRAQPADCATPAAPAGPVLPMALNLGGLPGVPRGVDGQIYVGVPLNAGGMTCDDRKPPRDILRGEPGDVLHGAGGDLLRGPDG